MQISFSLPRDSSLSSYSTAAKKETAGDSRKNKVKMDGDVLFGNLSTGINE